MIEKSTVTRLGKAYHEHDPLRDCLSTAPIAFFFVCFVFLLISIDSGLTFLED